MHSYIQRSSFICLVIVLSFSSCKKDEDDTPITGNGNGNSGVITAHDYLSGVLIEANFRGLIRDENDQPISDVEVSIGTTSTYTDADGIWQIIDVMVDTERAYIRAEKAGYFHGSRALTPTGIGFNRAFITLMTAQTVGSVSSSTGGEVTHSSGSMASLPADGYVDENGNAYSGMVDVQMTYLDPSDLDILEQMPGNLTALDAEEDFVALITYGMIGVELVGSGGESLQLAPGAAAEITVPVPPEGMASAPASIPLWHFDEEDGVWKEDGSASLVGNEYVGTVSHFSFWNCDIPTDYIFLDGYAYGDEGVYPVQGVQIIIISEGFGNGYAYTNQEGYFGGIIPGNELLTMEVYAPCGEQLSSQEIGPFSGDVTLLPIDVPSQEFGIITGTLVDCGGEIGQGYVSINANGFFPEGVEVGQDGNFVLSFSCPPLDVELTGYSTDYLTNSGTIAVSTIAGQSVSVGSVNLCANATDEYIVFTYDGETYSIIDSINVNTPSSFLYINASQFNEEEDVHISINMDDTSDPPVSSFGANANWIIFTRVSGQTYAELSNPGTPIMDWNFTTYNPMPGDYLEFTFTGTYDVIENGENTVEVATGYGRVQRD